MKIYEKFDNELKEKLIDLSEGSLIILPTDTVYGLGVKINNFSNFNDNISKIYKLKNRSFNKKIIMLLSDIEYMYDIIDSENIDDKLIKIIDRYMPGSLSIILKSNNQIKKYTDYDTIGIRIPDNNLTRDIIRELGGYIFVTSANISGDNSPKNFLEISNILKEKVDILIKNDNMSGVESTIIDYTNKKIKILREGIITKKMLEEINK